MRYKLLYIEDCLKALGNDVYVGKVVEVKPMYDDNKLRFEVYIDFDGGGAFGVFDEIDISALDITIGGAIRIASKGPGYKCIFGHATKDVWFYSDKEALC